MGRECYGKSELPLLFDISILLNNSREIKDVLNPILERVCTYIDAERGLITILNRNNSVLTIEGYYGLSPEEKDNGTYKIGEGIIGEVVRTGTSMVIPDIDDDKRFLNKTKFKKEVANYKVAFICVPVITNKETIGTISIHRTHRLNYSFASDEKLLSIVGSIIAQAIRSQQDKLEEIQKLRNENDALKFSNRPQNIIGNSGKMHEVYELIKSVSATSATVLIRGESGVGKEMIAEAIHNASPRKGHAFIKVNCSALPENLIESELFGHEKGSFTGASEMHKGRFELANDGTIFLDEIGDLPLTTQVKLLRVLQQREFERIGGTKTIKVDVRIIAATNRILEDLMGKNLFRDDLYYRINVFPIFIPPLRERKNDISGLVDFFIEKYNRIHGLNIKRISSSAIDLLMLYHWPGNIRELENCIERAMILSLDGVIRSSNLPPTLQTAESSDTRYKGTLHIALGQVEKQMIIDTMIITRGNVSQAAEIMGITERILGLRIRKYKIDAKRYKILEYGRGQNQDKDCPY